jgi:hypothetical protein
MENAPCVGVLDRFGHLKREVERSERPRLGLEAQAPRFIVCEDGGQQLQGDLAPERGIARAEHFAHSPDAEE